MMSSRLDLQNKVVDNLMDQIDDVVEALSYYRLEVLGNDTVDLTIRYNAFPVEKVLYHYHLYGKHFAQAEVLEELQKIQIDLCAHKPARGSTEYDLLKRFLHTLLDKQSNRYDYLSYIGTQLLDYIMVDNDQSFSAYQEKQIAQLIFMLCDIMLMECETLTGRQKYFRDLLPDQLVLKRRIFAALKAIHVYGEFTTAVALPGWLDDVVRLWTQEVASDLPLSLELGELTSGLARSILKQLSNDERLILHKTILPVWTVHDEYMFIRILQCFEIIFSIVVKGFLSCQDNIRSASFAQARVVIEALTAIYQKCPALFRVLMTMQKENFAAFRVYTEGASAIQSERYKMIEALAASLPQARLHSSAFLSVPHIKEMYEQKQIASFESLLQSYLGNAVYQSNELFQQFLQSMRTFDLSFITWKHIHYRIAVKMLGVSSGTGGTPGTPYLKEYIEKPLFSFLA